LEADCNNLENEELIEQVSWFFLWIEYWFFFRLIFSVVKWFLNMVPRSTRM
jgi:hypothetical protein